MKIRLATIEDATAISRLVRPLMEKYVAHEFSEEGRRNLLSSCTPDAIDRYLRGQFRYHVAEQRGEIVGSVGVRENRHLFHLFVAESLWRHGIARSLWATARDAAELGNGGAGFTVNAARCAVPVYRAFGFVEAGPATNCDGVVCFPMRLTSEHE